MDDKFFIKAPATYDNLLAFNLKTRKMSTDICRLFRKQKVEIKVKGVKILYTSYEYFSLTDIYSYHKGDKSKKFYDRACRIDTQLIRGITPEGSQVVMFLWKSFCSIFYQ